MKFKSLLLAGIVSISGSVFAANLMNDGELGGWANAKGGGNLFDFLSQCS